MYTRHNEVPVYQTTAERVAAVYYNRARRALKRLGPEIRLQLPGLKTLNLILHQDAWIIVDRAFNDMPVAAWSDFQARRRSAVHEPVACRVRLYHANGRIVMQRVLDAMDRLLDERLANGRAGNRVIDFRRKE